MATQIHVLHVDDDAPIRDLTAECLERANARLTVHSERDPTVVPDRVRTDPIDCVVSDYHMPQMDGLTLYQEVRDTHPEIPFFLFTSEDDDEFIDAALTAGVTDIVEKESGLSHYKVLANRITNAVEHYEIRQQVEESAETG